MSFQETSMKINIKLFLFFCLITSFFIACEKKSTTANTAEKILGIWTLQSDIYHQHVGGIDYSDTTLGMGSTIEFRSDNKAYSDFQGQKDTAVYTLNGDAQITIIGTGTYDIKTLTSNLFILYLNKSQGADYYEETISLFK